MSTTALQVLTWCMAHADELDDTNGALNPSDTDAYQYRTPGILTTLQAELIKAGDLFSTHEIANYPATNMLGYASGFDYFELPDSNSSYTVSKEATGSVQAYYFEVSDDAVVYIEDYTSAWNTLKTVTCTPTAGKFTAYYGVVTPTAGATKSRIRFTCSYRCIFTNYAMFKEAYAADSDVPVYRPWVEKEMPSDFKNIDQIVEEYPQMMYTKSPVFKWEGKNKLYINYFYEGSIRIVYRPIPSVVATINDTLQLDDVTCRTLLVYGLGAELFKEEGKENNVYSHFLNRYRELKAFALIKPPSAEQPILDFDADV
jgi:hypothetical protein